MGGWRGPHLGLPCLLLASTLICSPLSLPLSSLSGEFSFCLFVILQTACQ